MFPLRMAVATRALNEPLKRAVQIAAEMGGQGVQFDLRNEVRPGELSETGRRQLLHYLDELNLTVASAMFPTRRTFYDQEELEARIAGTRQAMDFAYQLKTKVLTLRVGRIPEDAQSAEFDILRNVLNDLAGHGNRVGVTLAVTPTRDEPARLAEFLKQITQGPVGVNFDPAIFVMAGFSSQPGARDLPRISKPRPRAGRHPRSGRQRFGSPPRPRRSRMGRNPRLAR